MKSRPLVCSKEKAKAKRIHDNHLQITNGSFKRTWKGGKMAKEHKEKVKEYESKRRMWVFHAQPWWSPLTRHFCSNTQCSRSVSCCVLQPDHDWTPEEHPWPPICLPTPASSPQHLPQCVVYTKSLLCTIAVLSTLPVLHHLILSILPGNISVICILCIRSSKIQ